MANTAWSATDKTAGVTLSNTNHTATSASSGAGNAVRAADEQITGKFYWETTLTTASTSYGVGVATSAAGLSTMWQAPVGAIITYTNGAIWRDNVNTGLTLGSLGAGGVVLCHALDLTNGLYWARSGAAGNWNGSASANPVTGVGGVSTFGLGFPLIPAACFAITLAAAVTANFGDSAFTGTVPSGFTSGFTSGAAPAVNAVVTQEGVEAWASTSPNVNVTQIGEEAFVIPNPDFQLTQAGSEVWLAGTPALQLTQAGLEMWATVATTTVQMTLTQAGLEVWRTVADAPKGGPMISMIS